MAHTSSFALRSVNYDEAPVGSRNRLPVEAFCVAAKVPTGRGRATHRREAGGFLPAEAGGSDRSGGDACPPPCLPVSEKGIYHQLVL